MKVFNNKAKRILNDDGHNVYIFKGLSKSKDLDNIEIDEVKFATIVENFNFELLPIFKYLEILTIMDRNIKQNEARYLKHLLLLKRLVLVDSIIEGGFDFDCFEELEEVDLNWMSKYNFSSNRNLKELIIRKVDEIDLSFVTKNAGLEKVEIIQGKLQSLEGVEKLKKLKALTLFRIGKINSLTELKNHPNLEYLDLRSFKGEIDIEVLLSLKKLKWLVLENCTSVTGIDKLLGKSGLLGVKILKAGKLTEEEKEIVNKFPNARYGYVREQNVRNRMIKK